MKNINKSLLLFCLLIGLTNVCAKPSEAIFDKLEKSYTLHADGSMEYRCKKEVKLNTHLAFNNLYGETFIVYNPRFQAIKIHTAYTKQADGNIIQVPDNAYNEVLPRAASDAPAYNHLKEMVITHTGLEIGATIFLDYSVITRPGYYAELDINDVLQEQSPVKEYKVNITIPADKQLTYSLTGKNVKPAITEQNGNRLYRWNLKNIPPASLEPYQPLNNKNVPYLTASTYPSADAPLKAIAGLLDGNLPEEWKTFTHTLIKDKANDKDKIETLHNYVVKQIATIPLNLPETGYQLRPNHEVLKSSYGTVAEKTNLLIGMLQAAGYQPELLVSYPSEHVTGLAPIREIAIECNGKQLSAAKATLPSLVERNKLDKTFILSSGQAQPYTSAYTEKIKDSNSITLTPEEIQTAKECGYVVKPIRFRTSNSIASMSRLNSNRTEVLELPHLLNETHTLKITLPENMTLENSVDEIRQDKPFGSLKMSIQSDGKTVVINRELKIKQQQIVPAQYDEFRSFITTWLDNANNQLIFKMNN